MILVRFYNIRIDNGREFFDSETFKVLISGHAGDNVKGRDIVCSAVSALSQTLVLSIERLIKAKQTVKIENGFMSATVETGSIEQKEKLKLLIESFLIGILEIQKEHPGRIRLDFEVC